MYTTHAQKAHVQGCGAVQGNEEGCLLKLGALPDDQRAWCSEGFQGVGGELSHDPSIDKRELYTSLIRHPKLLTR
jgi:hypothetical protein